MEIQSFMAFLSNSWRLLKIAKKPDRTEVWLVIKVTGMGMAMLGLLGFMIRILFQFVT